MARTIRKAKTGAKQYSSHCQNHGACDWCVDNRTHFDKKWRVSQKEIQKEIEAFFEDQLQEAC